MACCTDNISDRGVEGRVSQAGFRPSLYTVAAGSYASNAVYGSGAAAVEDYDSVDIPADSSASLRQEDSDVDFSLRLILDLEPADPITTDTNEIRLRTIPLGTSEPARYLRRLPVHSVDYGLPLFLDVEIIDPSTGAPFAGFPSVAGIGQLQARLLHGGDLALVVTDLSAGPPPTVTPLTAADLTPLFGAAAGTELLISVRGSYRGE